MRARATALATAPATALALAAVLLVGGCGDDGGGEATAGDLVQGRLGELDGTSHTLLLPNGELTVVVGDGVDEIGPTEAADGQEHPAPDGTEWLALDWRLDPGAGLDPLQRTLMEDTAQRTSLALVAGEDRTDLGDAPGSTATPAGTRTSGIVWVAVETGAEPVVEVSFDGVTTTIDPTTGELSGDQAEALTDLPAPTSAACPPLRGSGGRADVDCAATVTTVPYLAGKGWSADGWTVAQVETRVDEFVRGQATYAVQEVADASTLDGGGESTVVDDRLDSLVTRVVAEGAAQRLEVARVLTGVRSDGEGPEDASLQVGTTIDLG